jgi:hypothetical protein
MREHAKGIATRESTFEKKNMHKAKKFSGLRARL